MAARVPYVERDELDAEGQEIYDRIRRDRNVPQVSLQFRALLHSPKAAGYLNTSAVQRKWRLQKHAWNPSQQLSRRAALRKCHSWQFTQKPRR